MLKKITQLLSSEECKQVKTFDDMIISLENHVQLLIPTYTKESTVSSDLLNTLCSGSIYNFIIDRLSSDEVISWYQSTMNENAMRFMEKLTQSGYLKYESSSLDSFQHMVISKNPFYEVSYLNSYH